MDKLFTSLCKEDSGQGMVEYAFLLALVALVATAGFEFLGNQIKEKIDQVSSSF